MFENSDLKIRDPVNHTGTGIVFFIYPRIDLIVGFHVDKTAFFQQIDDSLGRVLRLDIDFAIRPLGFLDRVALFVFGIRIPLSICYAERYEFVTALPLAAFGILTEITGNGDSLHRKVND